MENLQSDEYEFTQDYYYEDDYAGFWLRFAAYLIDGVVMSTLAIVVLAIFGLQVALLMAGMENPEAELTPGQVASIITMYLSVIFGSVAFGWLYFALQESSKHQATLGKRAVGIKVTDLHGDRISFMRATGRYFSKILSGMILYIGFIMAGFTEHKQALHDMIASTYVLKKDAPPLS